MMSFKEFYEQFLAQLEQAKSNAQSQEFQNLLRVVEPDWKPEEQLMFAEYCQTKAGLFALFGENLDMDDWMQKSLQFSEPSMFTHIYFKWILLYWHQQRALNENAKITANFSALYNVAEQAVNMEKNAHNKLAFASVKALSLAALGKHAEAEEEILAQDFQDIPTKLVNDKNQLNYFFANIYKMLVASLEIRSEACLQKVLSMITIDDYLMQSSQPLFRKFNQVVMDIADIRPEMAADFNYFYQMRRQWSGFLPNFSLFSMMVEEENSKGLELFFGALKE